MSRKDWSRVGLPFQKKLSEEKLIKVKLVNAMLCSSDRRRRTSFLPILHILTQLDKLNVYLNYRNLLPPPPLFPAHTYRYLTSFSPPALCTSSTVYLSPKTGIRRQLTGSNLTARPNTKAQYSL